jgi:hypothetical protein
MTPGDARDNVQPGSSSTTCSGQAAADADEIRRWKMPRAAYPGTAVDANRLKNNVALAGKPSARSRARDSLA